MDPYIVFHLVRFSIVIESFSNFNSFILILGSGQQSVTGMTDQTDANSYWQVIGAMKKECIRGTPIKCGQTIRLMHIKTNKYLHSHHFQAPMSRDQVHQAYMWEGIFVAIRTIPILCSLY